MKRLAAPLLGVAIFLLNLWLNAPLFMAGELPFRGSIEGDYVAMARFLSQHPDPWGWNPLVYCGLPVQFTYVPALPYASALAMHLFPGAAPDTVYRVIVGLMTCLGPVTLFWFALHFTGSLRWSFAAAVGYSFLSPSYGLFPAVEKDRGIVQLPWRIQVLAKYGEGPHNTGLTLLPLALLAVWRAGRSRSYRRIFAAAVLLAAIPLVNWVAAFTLAICCLLLLLAAWGRSDFAYWPALAAAGMAYLFAALWLTPSFIKTIVFNWPVDSFGYELGRTQVWLLAGLVAGVAIIRLVFHWLRGSTYFCLVTMGAFAFGWIATAFYVYGADTIPESRRYAIEFELFLAMALAEGLRLALANANSTVRLSAIGTGGMLLLAGTPQVFAYVTQGWRTWTPAPPETTVEHQLATWIEQHPPLGRVYASGGLRFRLNSWYDLPQVGGGFETGLQNRGPVALAYRLRSAGNLRPDYQSDDTLLAMKALGVQYVVVHGPKSREYYRDFVRPERVASLPVAYRVEDDTVYALPPRPLAHLVQPADLPTPGAADHPDRLAAYVAAIEDPARPPLRMDWSGPGAFAVTGPIAPGDLVSVQVNATPGWQAVQDGRGIPIAADSLGFMVLHPAPAPAARIDLRYRGTAEQRIMAAVSLLAWLAAIAMLWRAS